MAEHMGPEAGLPGFKSWLCLSLAGDLWQALRPLQLPSPFSCLEDNVSNAGAQGNAGAHWVLVTVLLPGKNNKKVSCLAPHSSPVGQVLV